MEKLRKLFATLAAAALLISAAQLPAYAEPSDIFDSGAGLGWDTSGKVTPASGEAIDPDTYCPSCRGLRKKNPVTKYGVIVNGDTEARHTTNADNYYDFMQKYYSVPEANIYVLSTHKSKATNDYSAKPDDLAKVQKELNAKIDDNDILYLYTTGHGDKGRVRAADGKVEMHTVLMLQGHSFVTETAWSQAWLATKATRISFLADQCYSGGFAKAMVSDPNENVLAISSTDPNNSTVCGFFIVPYLDAFKDMKNDNDPKDGKISEWEAFKVATHYSETAHSYHGFPEGASNTQYMVSGDVNHPGRKVAKAPKKPGE